MAGPMKAKGDISIWFFCGILSLVYGVVLVVQGIYDFSHPPATVLHELHPTLWWGALMTLAGGIYSVKFRPGRS